MEIINWELMRNPSNWIVVTLMVVLASLALTFVCKSAQV